VARGDAAMPRTREEAAAAREALLSEVTEADEPALRATLAALRAEKNAAANEHVYHTRAAEETDARLREIASRARVPEDASLTEAGLRDALPAWESVDAVRKQAMLDEYDELKARNGYLNGRRADLARQLGLDPETARLDLEKERADRDALARDHRVRERAVEILRLARDRILDKVLPYTLEHMRRILPSLTMDRYHDAKLTSDYKIEVWDERAGMWKAKNIFSGGTRDQFSLALRLAFAMATLPQERGAAPGFIFLDEPLSSFDTERSDALMYLLTRGEIADTFDQIFVISHNQSIAANEFQQRLVLDAGRITDASEDLKPAPALELELEEAESVVE
jgi:DNA repair exonuclease SbcCD ATPase subunit